MTKVSSPRGRGAVLLGMIAVLGLTTVYVVATASADGRALTGDYCTSPTGGTRCMQITWDGVAYGTNNRDDLTLRPGEYWLTVNDTGSFGPFHNFELRSCPWLDVGLRSGLRWAAADAHHDPGRQDGDDEGPSQGRHLQALLCRGWPRPDESRGRRHVRRLPGRRRRPGRFVADSHGVAPGRGKPARSGASPPRSNCSAHPSPPGSSRR